MRWFLSSSVFRRRSAPTRSGRGCRQGIVFFAHRVELGKLFAVFLFHFIDRSN